MQISKVCLFSATLALAACETPIVSRSAPVGITLPDGLVVAGARGWCVDQATTQTTTDAAVVIFGSCAALRGDASAPRPVVPGIVTVSIESKAANVPSPEVLAEYLRTESGRAALSRDGVADSVEILESEIRGNTLLLHALDRSGFPEEAAEEYWRGLFDLRGRVVTVSIVAPNAAAARNGEWMDALDAQISTLKTANPGT